MPANSVAAAAAVAAACLHSSHVLPDPTMPTTAMTHTATVPVSVAVADTLPIRPSFVPVVPTFPCPRPGSAGVMTQAPDKKTRAPEKTETRNGHPRYLRGCPAANPAAGWVAEVVAAAGVALDLTAVAGATTEVVVVAAAEAAVSPMEEEAAASFLVVEASAAAAVPSGNTWYVDS